MSDVVVKSSSGKKNLTQIEVIENVRKQFCLISLESMGICKVSLQVDLYDSVYVLDDRLQHECVDHHDLRRFHAQSN